MAYRRLHTGRWNTQAVRLSEQGLSLGDACSRQLGIEVKQQGCSHRSSSLGGFGRGKAAQSIKGGPFKQAPNVRAQVGLGQKSSYHMG